MGGKRMKIWIVNHYAIPPNQPGGTRHYSLSRALIDRGHEVTIIAASFDHMTREETRLQAGEQARLEVLGDVPFLWVRASPYQGNGLDRLKNTLTFSKRFPAKASQLLGEKPDVILGSSPHLFAADTARKLARKWNIPFVLETRDLWPQTLIDIGNLKPGHPMVRWMAAIERRLYREAKQIITLAPLAVNHIARCGGTCEKTCWIPNGIDLSLLPSPQPPPSQGVFTLMHAGSHAVSDGLETLLVAALLLQSKGLQARFRFIGDGNAKASLIQHAKSLGLHNVSFEDPVPKSDIYRLLAQADAFVVNVKDSPLFKYGASFNKFFDYLAMARPTVIAANIPRNPFVESGAGIQTPPDQPEAMANAIEQLMAFTPEERAEMGLRGRRYVEEHHDTRALGARLETLLQEVTNANHAFSHVEAMR